MSIKTIYIARHGFSINWDKNEEDVPIPRTGIETDFALSDHGIVQSRELSHYLLSLDAQPDIICTSPFFRCVQTSEYISKLLKIPTIIDQGLSEWFEKKEDSGDVPVPSNYDILTSLFPNLIKEDWGNGSGVIPNIKGEDLAELYNRCKLFLSNFVTKIESEYPDVETVLLMTHAPVKTCLGHNLLNLENCTSVIDDDGSIIRNGCCSLDKYELQTADIEDEEEEAEEEERTTLVQDTQQRRNNEIPYKDRKWKITMNGNCEFLRKGEEMHWDFRTHLKEKNPSNDLTLDGEDEDEMETVYVSVDLSSGSYKEALQIDKTGIFQYSGLDQENPLIRIGDKVYEGSWKKLVGTEFAFPNAASLHTKSNNHSSDEDSDDEGSNRVKVESEIDKIENDKSLENQGEKIYRIAERLTLSSLHPV